jgi:signal transduction histidine kinase/HD-like signal output (HDOD) protein/ActR/RegA family two-component response regulator
MKKKEIKWNVSKLEKLPTLSSVATQLIRLTMDERSDADQVAAIIETDQSLSSKILQMVNSPSYGFSGRVTSISNAVSLMGFHALRTVALGMTVSDMFAVSEELSAFDRVAFWKHSLGVAVCAEVLGERLESRYANEAFLAGLFHDIGKVALDTCAREDFDRIIKHANAKHVSVLEAEKELLGTDHAVVGKWVAERWGLPDMFTHAVWLHHQPAGSLPESGFDRELVEIVHLANIVVRGQMIGSGGDSRVYPVSQRLLNSLGLKEEDLEEIKPKLWKLVEERASIINLEATEKGLYLESLQRANQELSKMALAVQQRNRELGRKAKHFAVLHEMNTKMLPSQALPETLSIIAESLRDGLGVGRGFLFMADGERELLEGKIWTDKGGDPQDLLLSIGGPVAGAGEGHEQLDTAVAETIQETSLGVKDSSWVGERLTDILQKNDLVVVPMVAQGKSVGQIVIDNRDKRISYTEKELQELLAFASAAGLAMSRYKLQEKLNERSEELAAAIWKEEMAREQLMRSERLASVGKMAAGAAHEINNPLAVISGRAQMLLKNEKDEKKAKSLRLIVEQTRRASKILTDLMGFARPAMPKAEPTNVNFVINHVLSMVENQLRLKNIECVRELAQGMPKILADKHQLEQVFLNIVLNAEHAMEEKGSLTVSTSLSSAKDKVVVRFTDTGKGIPKENLQHIFEPFFTTKEEGEGTGLGLSMSYGIITSHGGAIDVDSTVGEGTTFTIEFPVAVDVKEMIEKAGAKTEAEAEPTPKKRTTPASKKGQPSILIVDDEEHIRDLLSDTLSLRGYGVETAENGLAALGVLSERHVDLVLLDIRMPIKDGLGLLDEITDKLPSLPVIIVTGLASNEEVQEALRRGAFSCLRKPFEIDALVEEAERALGQREN